MNVYLAFLITLSVSFYNYRFRQAARFYVYCYLCAEAMQIISFVLVCFRLVAESALQRPSI